MDAMSITELGTGRLRFRPDGTASLEIAGATYGAGGRGSRIRYGLAASEFGVILAAETAHGLCWVGVEESAERLQRELRTDFPKAEAIVEDPAAAATARRVADFALRIREAAEFALDIPATPFQRAVWRELCSIPRGQTRSYGELAQRIGKPNAARAVGRANGSNPLAILIPCHRAIGGGGALTGYRWGVEIKQRLLAHEQALARPRLILTVARDAVGAG
jgi:AraC family transcriptional regulator of adaptative response/methylated-DNA-[protein]-cysteine methyltransferase